MRPEDVIEMERRLEARDVAFDGLVDIVTRRWLTEPKAKLRELAEEYGVSAERVRQIEAQALRELKGVIAGATLA